MPHRASPDGPSRGRAAEARAEAYLQTAGLRPVTRNYRCRAGELDLVMRERDTLVFVEVRARRHARYGAAAETVDARKRRRLLLAAQHYLQAHDHRGPARFDVLAITGGEIEWIRDAFGIE